MPSPAPDHHPARAAPDSACCCCCWAGRETTKLPAPDVCAGLKFTSYVLLMVLTFVVVGVMFSFLPHH